MMVNLSGLTESTAVTKQRSDQFKFAGHILVSPNIKVLLRLYVDMLNSNIVILFLYAKNVFISGFTNFMI